MLLSRAWVVWDRQAEIVGRAVQREHHVADAAHQAGGEAALRLQGSALLRGRGRGEREVAFQGLPLAGRDHAQKAQRAALLGREGDEPARGFQRLGPHRIPLVTNPLEHGEAVQHLGIVRQSGGHRRQAGQARFAVMTVLDQQQARGPAQAQIRFPGGGLRHQAAGLLAVAL